VLPKEWTIASGVTGYLEVVAPPALAVRVAGAEVQVPASGRASREQALLGAYTVTVAPGPLYEAAPQTVALTGDLRNRSTVTSVEVTPTIRAAARDEVVTLVRTFVDQCASQTEPRPRVADADCPFAYNRPVPSGATDLRWTVVSQPAVDLVRPGRAQKDVELEVRTATAGKAELTYTYDGTQYGSGPVGIEVRGVIWLENGAVRFTPAG
jgi:hypothetical protein